MEKVTPSQKRSLEPNATLELPDPIPDATPEEIARALLNTPPRKPSDWKFMKAPERTSS